VTLRTVGSLLKAWLKKATPSEANRLRRLIFDRLGSTVPVFGDIELSEREQTILDRLDDTVAGAGPEEVAALRRELAGLFAEEAADRVVPRPARPRRRGSPA